MNSKNILLVPVHLDALFVPGETMVTEAFADFSRLPFSKDHRDHNPDTANISESILSPPLQNQNLNLPQGLHLHWALPDALTKGGTDGTPNSYPAVPNRWLITKKNKGRVSRQWIVESDYAHHQADNKYGSITFPDATLKPEAEQPFYYLGRQLDLAGWQEDPSAKRIPRLTAIGYGEPAFAAFYPNCHSVFGCYDPDITEANMKGISYQLTGWYSRPEQDPLYALEESKAFKQHLFAATKKAGSTTGDTNPVAAFFRERWGWAVSLTANDLDQLPQGVCCYAQLDMAPAGNYTSERRKEAVSLSIGNTGTEALSAFLANQIVDGKGDRSKTEEQLDGLLAYKSLGSKQLDLGARFREARHEKGFKAERGGSVWEIGPSHQKDTGTAQNDKQEVTIDLPPATADLLNSLNEQQYESDRLAARLRHRKHLLFADWYKYMLCAYPPDDGRDNNPDIDLVKNYIERTLLVEPLKQIEPSILPELRKRIQQFNDSDVPALVSARFHKKENQIPAEFSIANSESKWLENLPFSDYCLQLNKDRKDADQLSIPLTSYSGVKALSLWINLAATQPAEAVLLATKNEGPLIGKTGMADCWKKVAINGEILPASEPLQWHLLPKNEWFHLHVEWKEHPDNDDILYLFANDKMTPLSGKLASIRLFDRHLNIDELMCDMNVLGHHLYELKEVPGPRYWQPAEPVIVLEGAAVQPTNRHGADGRLNSDNTLTCTITSMNSWPLQNAAGLDPLTKAIEKLKPAGNEIKIGFDIWTTQPWNPFLLEWEVEVHPMAASGNLSTNNRNFKPGFITDNYSLPANSPELSPKPGRQTTPAASLYTGRSLLTPHAKTRFLKVVEDYFNHLKQEDGYQVVSAITKEEKEAYGKELKTWYDQKPNLSDTYASAEDHGQALQQYNSWYQQKPVFNGGIVPFSKLDEAHRQNDFIHTVIQAALKLAAGHFLSQALSGFNNALLMHRQTLQLPVGDPLGFPEYQAFTERVKKAIAGNNNLAPMPHNDFLPIRTGTLTLHRLRIIDSFGQAKDLSIENCIASASLGHPDHPNHAWLPPRFVPSTRIQFRWLSARSDRHEMNSHPQSNPICGWLLANHLDNSLMVYDSKGHALGIIDRNAAWRTAPGTAVHCGAEDIPNPHLRKIVRQLALPEGANEQDVRTKKEGLQQFITTIDKVLDEIHPETNVQGEEIALLISRPLAVVRASLSLQLKEGPPIHHGWDPFLQDLWRNTRDTNDFEKVNVPVRLGDRNQLNDGLVGYWIEDEEQALGQAFYSTASDGQEATPIRLTLEETSLKTLTLLVDPQGDVHATTGMLPVKAIHIPRDQYAPALKAIHVTFLTAPVLTGRGQISLPLPREMGYEWSWLARERFSWVEVAENGVVRKDSALQIFSDGAELWQHLLDKGWLVETDDNRARVVPADQRRIPALEAPFSAQADTIQHWLDAGHIVPADTAAGFPDKQCIREGWLQLKPS